jgi:hypothetical protein
VTDQASIVVVFGTLALGCAAATATGPTREPAAELTATSPAPPEREPYRAVFPPAPGGCVPVGHGTHEGENDPAPPLCLPKYSYGAQIARDDATRLRVFQACEVPWGRHSRGGTLDVDRRRMMVERTGARPATTEELEEILRRPRSRKDGGLPEIGWSVRVGQCLKTQEGNQNACLLFDLMSIDPDPSAFMATVAPLLSTAPNVCIPMVVAFGVGYQPEMPASEPAQR